MIGEAHHAAVNEAMRRADALDDLERIELLGRLCELAPNDVIRATDAMEVEQ